MQAEEGRVYIQCWDLLGCGSASWGPTLLESSLDITLVRRLGTWDHASFRPPWSGGQSRGGSCHHQACVVPASVGCSSATGVPTKAPPCTLGPLVSANLPSWNDPKPAPSAGCLSLDHGGCGHQRPGPTSPGHILCCSGSACNRMSQDT